MLGSVAFVVVACLLGPASKPVPDIAPADSVILTQVLSNSPVLIEVAVFAFVQETETTLLSFLCSSFRQSSTFFLQVVKIALSPTPNVTSRLLFIGVLMGLF